MIDLDEIERRIPSPATECAFCHRLATAVCPVCGTMTCEDHRRFHARDAVGTDCDGVAMIPAHHDAATMDRVALVAEVRRLRADLATARAAAHTADDIRVSQIEELCAVIDGSPDAPTDDELAAHTGAWLARLYNDAFATMTATAVRNARGVFVRGGPYAVRWWALDPSGGFCPRPVVTTVATATLGAGPRDADGREVTP